MHLVLDDLGFDNREFGHLMAIRLRVISQQQCPTPDTTHRLMHHDFIHVFHQRSMMALMPWLPAAFTRGRACFLYWFLLSPIL
jgi:hypothetical protein